MAPSFAFHVLSPLAYPPRRHPMRIAAFRVSVSLAVALLIASANTYGADDLPPDHAQRFAVGLEMFEKDVKGLLTKHCVGCHGGEKTRGDLDLATREGLLKGGGTGPALVPFKPNESLLVKLITHAEEPAMPD